MLPSVLTSQLQQGVEDFLRTTFPTTTPHFHGMLDRFFEREGSVFKGPYVSVDLPFCHSGHGADYFPDVPLEFPPYQHQADAFARLAEPERRSTLIATGTGSGKTEAFLWPILDSVRERKKLGGIKAILIYPMNALANDQAGRIAEAVHDIPALEGVRAGLYVGDQAERPTVRMGSDHVITSREGLRTDPPDILLTNYKMLDYLLTRPSDSQLWRYNEPETLRYLVVDELHTFDGAQGTDLGCLIRRLKDRLDAPEGHLCCVGTSATLGGAEDFDRLRDYARDVFGEPFGDRSVIGERREPRTEFLEPVTEERVPAPDEAQALRPDAYDTPEAYLRAQVPRWLSDVPSTDIERDEGRVELGERLRHHSWLRALLDELASGPRPTRELIGALADRGLMPEGPASYQRAALDSFLSLLAWARSTTQTRSGDTELMPFVQLRLQLWLRELRRMVGSVEEEPSLTFWDDLPEGSERDSHLPLVRCLECGAMGWLGLHRQHEPRFHAELKDIYQRYFNSEPTFSFAFPMPASETVAAEGTCHQLCGHDLYFSDPEATACEACGREDRLIEVFRPNNRKTTNEGKQVGSNDCPFCGTQGGLTIVGSRAASLTSVLISQLYASSHNDDKKLLTFSDSVQDAAHRAGFFEARTYRFNLRGAIQQFVERADTLNLDQLQEAVAEHYREAMGDKRYVSTFIAPDMEWFREFEALQEKGEIPKGATLVEDVSRRLAWEVWSEYSFRARIGRTLEKTGSSVAGPDPDRLEAATDKLLPQLRNEIEAMRDAGRADVRRFLRGIVQHLKNRGAVYHPELETYVEQSGNAYPLNRRPHMPSFGRRSRLPAFVSERSTKRFDPVLGGRSGSGRSWLEAWAIKCFREGSPLLEGSLDVLYDATLDTLVEADVLDERRTSKGHRVWGLRPDALLVSDETAQLRCERCGHNVSVAEADASDWEGISCLQYQCAGRYAFGPAEGSYYRRLYSHGDLRRIVAREHTGLLEREVREEREQAFQQSEEPWAPNLLSSTPTLELGVDVGQLSSVILCSVPPNTASFVQRIGRGGRRSGNAIDVTVANGRPHDLYFFEDPTEMIDGSVEPPGVFLGAVEVLLRQYVAYCFDQWIASGVSEEAVPSRLSKVLRGLDDSSIFPHTWLSFVESHEDELFEGFVDLFGDALSGDRVKALERTIQRGGGIRVRVLKGLAAVHKRRKDLRRKSRRLYRRIRDLEDDPADREEEIEEMRREKKALQSIYQRLGKKNTYNFFTDAGLLPNYAFPESGVTLRSILHRAPKDGPQEVWDEEFVRPAPQALVELAPGATFYANGRRVKVDQIDASGDDTFEEWRLCDRCAYMTRTVKEESDIPSCPRCGSPGWSDQGQVFSLVRHDEVQATTSDRRSRVDDSSEGREREFFETMFFTDVEKRHVEEAYRIDSDELPFGFEWVREATFREINFGRPWKQSIGDVAGREVNGQGFKTCPACGRVALEGDSIDHTRSCPTQRQNGSSRAPEQVSLYRTFTSEAVRILLPATSFAGTPEHVESFKAAFELGLEEEFEGSVAHLKTRIQEGPGDRDIANRRYLVVYDSVPGGTGYLERLLREDGRLMSILEQALDVVRSCSCTDDPDRDGCYQCVYAYRNHYDMPHTSRAVAEELLEDILAHREELIEIDTVGDIPVHGALESELEARFIERLRDLEVEPSRVEEKVVRGRAGYELRLGDRRYDIEPQVAVGPEDGVARHCRIDFVIRPHSSSLKPIAVFLDGLQYHRSRIGRDMAQRRALRASGNYYVWSLAWRDITTQTTHHARNYLCPTGDTYVELLSVMGEERSQKARQFAQAGSFEWLIDLLHTQDVELFARVALAQVLLLAREQTDSSPWLEEVRGYLPAPLADALEIEADRDEVLLGMQKDKHGVSDPVTIWASATSSAVQELPNDFEHAKRNVTMALHLDDDSDQPHDDFERDWNGFLRLYNLLQFVPASYPVTADADAFQEYQQLI